MAASLALRRFRAEMTPRRRLHQLLDGLASSPGSIGTLKLGAIEYEVPASLNPSRLPRSKGLLDIRDPANVDNLHFMLQKYLLGQDVFLVSQPGPYARRLALTFAKYACVRISVVFMVNTFGQYHQFRVRVHRIA